MVHHRLFGHQLPLLFPGFKGHGLGQRVGHVHHRGDSARCRGAAFGGDVGLVRQPRVAEVHVLVDYAGQQVAVGGIDGLGAFGGFGLLSGQHAGDSFAFHEDSSPDDASLVDNACMLDE